MPIAFITGATAGFGRAIATQLAEHGWNVIICGRRQERLRMLEKELSETYGIQVLSLPFDVRIHSEVKNAIHSSPHHWKEIDVLVNNAGLASGLSLIHEGDIADWETMIDTNLKGLLYVSKEIMPWMVKRSKGHIVNIGSIAGKEAYLKGNVYCATKHAVDAISKSMRIDMLPYGIKVTAIHPGAAETEFSVVRFKGDAARADQVYQGYEPLRADDIADTVYFAVTRPAHVVINEMVITPLAQANTSHLVRQANETGKP
jgi:NADP-dependent 3-hydroxy acid dehydrogenase YdfG